MGSLVNRLLALGALSGAVTTDAHALDTEATLQLHAARRIRDDGACPSGVVCDTPFNEQRLQLKLEQRVGDASIFGKFDVARDAAVDDNRHETRELYADYASSHASMRVGRQIITWGVGDLVFINDVFPKNWNALFSGQPVEYLKRGSDAVKLNAYPTWANVELVVSEFRADLLPDPRRFIFEGVPADTPRSIAEHSDTEFAIKLSRMFGSWDAAAYAYRGFFHSTAYAQTAGGLVGSFPRLDTYGASLAGAALGGVVTTEVGYYDSVADRLGTDPVIENAQTKALVGYSREVAEDTTFGAQYFVEYMHDYDDYRTTLPSEMTPRERTKKTVTVRFTQRYLRQTLTFNVFGFWGVSDHDSYITPSLRYAFSDQLNGELGANVFNGRAAGQFGSLDRNDNLYVLLRYSF